MENQQTPVKAGLNAGLILGIVSVVLTFLIYFISPESLASFSTGMVILAIFLGALIFLGIQYRKSIGGFMDFGTGFKFAFIALIIAGLIGIVGNFLLYNVVDPELPGVLVEAQLETTMAMMERFGAADAMTPEQIDEIRNGAASNFTLVGQLKGFGFALIFYGIVALIVAAIIKKRDKSLDY
ncbi:hypothetical protein C943_02741 [Mariniradius saccharolyticus AK6]|jgi:hypothetical protein|uniref:DUF4199 domain-containing protein n=1 Tax=Mariniradius saccharolyticus AK6 TaxID=1239962 RepID=M7X8B1_9BACT|nr:DUF4199 domain-containing protein [Mariniradius saccharolyticus]EMS30953.1 hypothetical protein C943_02741 [Mariniradius saccharolyticus AK6]